MILEKKKKKTDWRNNTYLSLDFVHGVITQDQSSLPIFITVCFTFYISTLQISLTLFLINFFSRIRPHLFFFLVLYLCLVGS